jgi:sulfide:quinone oxidoreductase
MQTKTLTPLFSVSDQVTAADLPALQAEGVKVLVCNRPDGEVAGQPAWAELVEAATAAGMQAYLVPAVLENINAADVRAFAAVVQDDVRTHAFCRSGARSSNLWALAQLAAGKPLAELVAAGNQAGCDLGTLASRFAGVIRELNGTLDALPVQQHCPVLVIGGGAAGIALASSLLKRAPGLKISIVEPATEHWYQPGFTLVGGGIFKASQTRRSEASLMPKQVQWIKNAVTHILPEQNQVVLADDTKLSYERLVVCPGLKLNWAAIPGLEETLGKNGVTSNYRADLAPYTWELVQALKQGKAVFTQPPMPIKCAGAPQKAMYLSCDHWLRQGLLKNIDVRFCNAGAVLFGVKEYVPALMQYVERYGAQLQFGHTLVKVDGANKVATFAVTGADGQPTQVEERFDLLHVVPPQCAPDFIRNSNVADRAGWVAVNQSTLQHVKYSNIWSLGDVCSAPNAKTAAAVRKQAPIVACNIVADISHQQEAPCHYDGYGACPLTVEKGRVVMAEFSYGGKLAPSLPQWLMPGTKPTWLGWLLKAVFMPTLYFEFMLKGRELMVNPEKARR